MVMGGRGGLLAFIPSDRTSARMVQTGLYVPSMIAVAPDGTVWTKGQDVRAYAERPRDGTVIRHFDASGRLLGGFVA